MQYHCISLDFILCMPTTNYRECSNLKHEHGLGMHHDGLDPSDNMIDNYILFSLQHDSYSITPVFSC